MIRSLLLLFALCVASVACADLVLVLKSAEDVTAPTIESAAIDGDTATVTLSEVVLTDGTGFSGEGTTSGAQTWTYSTGSGTDTLTFTVSPAAEYSETVTLDYASATGDVADAASNELASVTDQAVTNNTSNDELAANSLRPELFGELPAEVLAAGEGYYPNDLGTSVRTNVSGTARAAVVEITGGTYTAPYDCDTTDRTYRLMGNVTFDGGGIRVNAANITVDLNGYTLTYHNVDVEGIEVGTVVSSTGGGGVAYPEVTPSGLTLSSNSHWTFVVEFLDGDEAGNIYEVIESGETTLQLINKNTPGGDTLTWENGGPAADDTFRIYNPRLTYGVGSAAFISGVEIINGTIVEGAATYGCGSSIRAGQGMTPILATQGTGWTIGGVDLTYQSDDCKGIHIDGAATVKYSEVTDNGTHITNRQATIGAITVGSNSTVQYCMLHDHRHAGISLASGSTAEYCEVYGVGRAVNCYGIGTYASPDVTIRYCNVYKVGDHPMGIALLSDGTDGCEVHNCWCESQTTLGGGEYPYNEAVGLTIRWGVRDAENYVHDCAFVTYSDPFDVGSASENLARTLFIGQDNDDDWDSELIEDCAIAAYNRDDTSECHAVAIAKHNSLVLRGCTVIGSHNLFWLADPYGHAITGGRFIDNTCVKVGSDPSFATFMVTDYETTDVDFISNTYGSGTGQADADFSGTWDSGTIIRFGYNLTVTVTDGVNPVEGAAVVVKDSSANVLRTGFTTDANGQVVVDVPTFYRHTNGTTTTSLSPLTVEASFGAADGTDTISPVADDTITIGIAE